MDESITNDNDQDAQALNAQPVDQNSEAANTDQSQSQDHDQEETNETDTSQPTPTGNTANDKEATEEWLRSKGLDPEDPEAFKKAANMAYNSEKLMSRTQQKSNLELERQLTSQPPQVSNDPQVQALADEVFNLRMQQTAKDFIANNNVNAEQKSQFIEFLQKNPDKQQLVDYGYMTVDEAYTLSGVGKSDTNAIKAEGGRETLEKLANQQRASSPTSNATTTAAPQSLTKANAESWYESLGPEGRANPANQAKLDAVLRS